MATRSPVEIGPACSRWPCCQWIAIHTQRSSVFNSTLLPRPPCVAGPSARASRGAPRRSSAMHRLIPPSRENHRQFTVITKVAKYGEFRKPSRSSRLSSSSYACEAGSHDLSSPVARWGARLESSVALQSRAYRAARVVSPGKPRVAQLGRATLRHPTAASCIQAFSLRKPYHFSRDGRRAERILFRLTPTEKNNPGAKEGSGVERELLRRT